MSGVCDIFGIITTRDDIPAENIARSALKIPTYCESKGEGILSQGNITLGHRRLSIINNDIYSQPMRSHDGQLCVTHNGEIYNLPELRLELSNKGHEFRSNSDTEVLFAAYREWGTDCLVRFRGMYAFALVDFEHEEVFLARDLFGQKPLFYRSSSGCFAFASTLPALVDLPPLPSLSIDPEAICLFFSYQYIPHPHTIYLETRKLPPGTALVVNFDGEIKRQWKHSEFSFSSPYRFQLKDTLDEADATLYETVRLYSHVDVPIGVLLSGGIDSTLISLYLARTSGREIPAFTMAFKEEEYSELEHASAAAEDLGLKLHISMMEESKIDCLGDILSHYGEPYGDSSVFPTWHIFQTARDQVKVVLSGDGGDELFGRVQLLYSLGPTQGISRTKMSD
jgi:asparagine synthase (glutamine-hydrolysing)